MEIVKNGICTIELFHGTSSIFLESIKKYGLGGVNLAEEYRLIESLAELKKVAIDHKVWNIDEFASDNLVIDAMIKQDVKAGGFNFRHGSLYLSDRHSMARGYAGNKYGSEILQHVIDLYDRVNVVASEAISSNNINVEYIESIKRKNSIPIVITLKDCVDFSKLKTEKGDEIDLESLESNYEESHMESFGKGFEYLGVVPYEKLKIEYL